MKKKKVVSTFNQDMRKACFDESVWNKLTAECEVTPCFEAKGNIEAYHKALEGADIILTGWTSPHIGKDEIALCPDLKLIAHSAGSVAALIGKQVWEKKVRVSSANRVLGKSVALTALGITITALKQLFYLPSVYKQTKSLGCREQLDVFPRELYDLKVGIAGFGAVGSNLAKMISLVGHPEILISDPGVDNKKITEEGYKPSDLETICKTCDVIHNCVPWIPATEGLFTHKHFKMMKDDAIYINTGRGATVDENALAAELSKGRLQAYLDVQYPEPPEPDSPLWTLKNCILFPHIGGMKNNGRKLLGRFAVNEILRFLSNKPLKGEITRAYADNMTGAKG
jgi:phosphoglycerate dehydrogenase-like enzyme